MGAADVRLCAWRSVLQRSCMFEDLGGGNGGGVGKAYNGVRVSGSESLGLGVSACCGAVAPPAEPRAATAGESCCTVVFQLHEPSSGRSGGSQREGHLHQTTRGVHPNHLSLRSAPPGPPTPDKI